MSHIIDEPAYAAGTKARIIANAQKTFESNPDNYKILIFIYENQWMSFMENLLKAYNSFGKLTSAQCASVLKVKAEREAKAIEKQAKAVEESAHHFNDGERLTLVAVSTKTLGSYESQYGNVYIDEVTLESGEKLIYKAGGASFSELSLMSRRNRQYNEGRKIEFKATIEHGDYKGVKQTIIKRPAIVKKSAINGWLFE